MVLTVSPLSLFAQSAASVSGTVTDSSGAVIAGAQIMLRNTGTNVVQETTTNGRGLYSIVNVAPGEYSLTVSKQGFNASAEKNIVLAVNQAGLFNVKLSPGSIQQTVTVSATPGYEQTTGATLGTVIATRSVNELPLNGRNFTQMLELTPGVSRISVSQAVVQNGGQTSHILGAFTLPSVNGQRNRSNMFLMDGSNDLNSYNGSYNYQPIVDAIQEFKVQSHSDLAQYGQVSGGVVNVVTKSGTNQFHGSLWEFIRNSAFDATNYFQAKVNPLRQNQFGGTVGGPVWIPHLYDGHNRTFFFFGYEGWRQSQANQSILTTPTPAQLSGDFSNLLANGVKIYNPYSTNPNTKAREVFPNNQIPQSLLYQPSVEYAKALFPAPQGNLPGGNYSDNTPIRTNSDSFTGRLDQAFGAHDFLFVRASSFNEPYTSSGGVPSATIASVVRGYNVTAHDTHSFGPTATLEGFFTRNVGDLENLLQYPKGLTQKLINAGFASSFLTGYITPTGNTIPGIGITGYLGVTPNNYSDAVGSDTYEYGGSFSKLAGMHAFQVGGTIATNNRTGYTVQTSETITDFQTSNLIQPTDPLTKASTGDALASFLLGVPNNVLRRNTISPEHDGYVIGAYAQDQIKITPKLNINLGIRWDASIWPVMGYFGDAGRTAYVGNADLHKGIYYLRGLAPGCSGAQGAPCIPGGVLPAHVEVAKNPSLHDTDYGNWQGRVGIAYQLAPKTSIHAGYGRFYDEWSFVSQVAQSVNGQWPSVSLLSRSNLNQTTVKDQIADPLHLGSTTITPATSPFLNSGAFYRDLNLLTPYSDQWNLGVEQALGANTKVGITYVGATGTNLVLAAFGNTATYPDAKTPVTARQPFNYIKPTQYYDNRGLSNYNSLQATLNKRSSQGLTYLVSYTYSKSIDNGCSGSVNRTACEVIDWYNLDLSRAVSAYDLTHMLSFSAVYQLPFGHGRTWSSSNPLVDNALGGWQINTIASLSSGTPYSVLVNSDMANTGNNFDRANQVGNPKPAHRTPLNWFNAAAFQKPNPGIFGNSPRDTFRSDWYRNVDLSVFKQFAMTEHAHLQFRAEAFNLTNTPVFKTPVNTVGTKNFGAALDTVNDPRQLQFAVKVIF